MLSVILPTFNEAKNLPELVDALEKTLTVAHEIIVVDDNSPDRTWEVAEALMAKGLPVHVLRRVGKRGLSSAVADGFAVAKGDVLAVMDSDLQHDPAIMMQLYQKIMDGADIAVASRYRKGGSVGEWVAGRRLLSKAGTKLAQWLPNVHSSDPMSGFFAVSRKAFDPVAHTLRPTGFKILLEVLAALPRGSRIDEVPLVFQQRKHGESKLNFKVEWDFMLQILRIAVHRLLLPLFFIVCAILAVVFATRAWSIHLLYTDAHIRSEVRDTLGRLADDQGWLLSDLSVQTVTADFVRVLHREHRRGSDPVTCLDLSLHAPEFTPCANF